MNFVDVLILGLVLLGALHGYQRGLINSIVGFLSNILGFLIATKEYMTALGWAEQYFPLKEWIEPMIYKVLLPSVQTKADTMQQQVIGSILGTLPSEWRSAFENLQGAKLSGAIEQITHTLSGKLAENILGLIAFGCVFYIVVVIIHIVVAILLRPLGNWSGSLNNGGGLIFGGLSTIIGLSVLMGLIFPVLQLGAGGGGIITLIQSSRFYPYLLGIFHSMDQAFSAQLSQKLLEPLSQGKGVWY